MSSTASATPEVRAIELSAQRKFHQIFTIPATDHHGTLKVTYAIAGVEHGQVPTILFCGGMFGTRWQAVWLNWMAERDGVRVIIIDRPGFGGSTSVSMEERIPLFLETVPLLLSHLGVEKIALVCHSAGTMYALNLLHYHPELLSTTKPSVTLIAPWVHQSITSMSSLTLASMLPNGMLNSWNKIVGFIANRAQPAFKVSGGVFAGVASSFKSKIANEESKRQEEEKMFTGQGWDVQMGKEVDKVVLKYFFEENTTGGNDEARLCLRSTEGTGWGPCEDYEAYVQDLAASWDSKVQEGAAPLNVHIVLPEEDALVGDKGMQYLEKCWGKDRCGKGINAKVTKLMGTDHDSATAPAEGAVATIFTEAKEGLS